MIRAIIARELQARKLLIPGNDPLKATVDITTTIRFTEAGLALLASKTRAPHLAKAAQRRYKALVGTEIQALLGWRSVRQVAREAGMDPKEVNRTLRGEKDIHVQTLTRLAAALHVPVEKLVAHLDAARRSPLKSIRTRPRPAA